MEIKPRSPLEEPHRWETGPVHHYHVIFWRQPHVDPKNLPEGVTREQVAWSANENDVIAAADVLDALTWATEEARERESIFTLYAVVDVGGREGMIWLAGWNPTVWSRPNFDRRQPHVA